MFILVSIFLLVAALFVGVLGLAGDYIFQNVVVRILGRGVIKLTINLSHP